MPTYESRRHRLTRTAAFLRQRIPRLRQRSTRLSWARLWAFLGALLAALIGASVSDPVGLLFLIAGLGLFGFVVYQHRRVETTIRRLQLWLKLKETHLARQALDWEHLPTPLPGNPDSRHPFEIDLDLTGPHSLHQLLDTAITVEGSTRLRDWLLQTVPAAASIDRRQHLVRELSQQPLFRDKLALYGQLSAARPGRWSSKNLHQWLNDPIPPDRLGLIVAVLGGLAAFNIVLGALNTAGLLPPYWTISFVLYAALSISRLRDLVGLFEEGTFLQDSLKRVQAVFTFLETYPYHTGHLKHLCAPFLGADRPAVLLRRLERIVGAASLQHNQLLWLTLNALIPWDLFFAYRLRLMKRQLQTQLPVWLDIWHELEALCALANFADLHPAYQFPHLETQTIAWEARSLGHPLIPVEKRITNDFTLEGLGQMALITGSNMSGKSTFLRTVGINMVLAYAGSVVPAAQFHLSLFRLFTCIRINDSLTDGFSYFYAEVRRLKALLDALDQSHPLPLFFLIDEIFRGTNNRERFIGSRSYIHALMTSENTAAHGLGLVSTHDLELTRLTEGRIQNYHFADSIQNDHLSFDYRLQLGPSITTNALKIMAIEGLPVPAE
ncbi:MAG TPA: hypothetical protein VHO69_17100 [Phototrophicaceae bacterium]|nr:hypothetical protein [Phototrophicaceae bacterium]